MQDQQDEEGRTGRGATRHADSDLHSVSLPLQRISPVRSGRFPTGVAVADSGPTQQDFHRKVGDSVVLPVHIPPRAKFAELFLRTTQDRKAVAFWEPGKYLTIVDGKYSGRLTFSPHTNSFNISSLRLVDGELYQAAISPGEPTETLIGAYRLSVFSKFWSDRRGPGRRSVWKLSLLLLTRAVVDPQLLICSGLRTAALYYPAVSIPCL